MIESHCNATCSIVQSQRHLNSSRTGLIRCVMFWLLWRLPWCSGRSKEARNHCHCPLKKNYPGFPAVRWGCCSCRCWPRAQARTSGGQAGWCSCAVGASVLPGRIYPGGTGITCLGATLSGGRSSWRLFKFNLFWNQNKCNYKNE